MKTTMRTLNFNQSFQKRLIGICLIFLLLAVTQLLTGCLDESTSGTESGTSVVAEPTPDAPLPPLTTPERTICDPFNTNSPAARDRGVVANMVWLDDTMPPRNGQPSLQHVTDYLSIGNIIPSTLYFDRLFVPTRAFDLGFVSQAGETILNHLGQPMYEYFALRMSGQFQLAPHENPGLYQISVLSDDGAVLRVSDGASGEITIVNNDGDHSTKMACPSQVVNMQRDTKLPFTLDYYQGPRFHISLVVMWRPLPDGTDPDVPVNDPRCGQQGNSLFFNSTVVPTAFKTPFYEILSRNWKVLENENYYFPAQATNPCVPAEETLSITAFQVTGLTRTSVTLNWLTNVDSDSQVEVRNVATGVVTMTPLASGLVKDHTVTVTGLSPNTLYAFKGISVSSGGQRAVSDERALRTPR
jgi:hypothetical protein